MPKFDNFEYRQGSNETEEQQIVFAWAKLQETKHKELRYMYHIPNEGKRTKTTGAQLQRIGLKRGVPDICLPAPRSVYHGLYVEMKFGKNRPTEEQTKYLDYLSLSGYAVALCYSAEDTINTIQRYLQLERSVNENV